MSELEFRIEGLTEEALRERPKRNRGGVLSALLVVAAGILAIPSAVPPILVSPAPLDFSRHKVGSTVEKTVHFDNHSETLLTPRFAGISGSNPQDFSLSSFDCQVLSAHGDCEAKISFTPSEEGSRAAMANFEAEEGAAAWSVELKGEGEGEGEGEGFKLPPTPRSSIGAEPVWLPFPGLLLGQTSKPGPVTVTNNGETVVHVEQTRFTEAGEFDISTNGCGQDLSPGQSCRIQVAFSPGVAGPRTSRLEIVTREGAAAHVDLSGAGLVRGVRLSPDPLRFASQQEGTRSQPQQITIENTGTADILTGPITLQGQEAHSFQLSPDCAGARIPAGSTCVVSARFVPHFVGLAEASLILADSAGQSLGSATLEGLGAPLPQPEIEVDPLRLDFTAPNPTSQKVLVRNAGAAPLRITGVSIGGENVNAFKASGPACLNQLILVGSRCSIQVDFTPQSTGKTKRSADVHIEHNAKGTPAIVPIHWEKVESPRPEPPKVTPSPAALDFGAVSIRLSPDQRPRKPITFANTGAVRIPALAFQIGPPGSKQKAFSIESNTCNQPLDPGGSCQIEVSFGPIEERPYTRTLTVWGGLNIVASLQLNGSGQRSSIIGRENRESPGETVAEHLK